MRILHCLRAPVGGLFRHVADLAEAQNERGHDVAVLCDAATGDGLTQSRLDALAGHCSLGVHRVKMSRSINPRDLSAYRKTAKLLDDLDIEIAHGHGAKGGAYARLAARSQSRGGRSISALYTPHGGSLHYDPKTLSGRIFLGLERHLLRATDGIIFESEFAAGAYAAKVGAPACASRVIANGLGPREFGNHAPDHDAAEFLFVGELRHLKGVDLLLRALSDIRQEVRARVLIVGDGPDRAAFERLAVELGASDLVEFAGAQPAREMFRRGRCLVLPSRAESFPYVILEAAAAGMAIIATDVGGIPEIFGPLRDRLIAPSDAGALAGEMLEFLRDPSGLKGDAERLRTRVKSNFSIAAMTERVLSFYEAVSSRPHAGANARPFAADCGELRRS